MPPAGNTSDFNPAARARAAIPDAWRELVSRSDGAILEAVSQRVETRTGIRPTREEVLGFLTSLATPDALEARRTSESHPGIRGPSIYPPPPDRGESR